MELIQLLNSSDEAQRIYAAQDIGETGDPELARYLVQRLNVETSQSVRDTLVFALHSMPCHQIYPQLFQLFHSSDAFLRNAAVGIFGSEKENAIGFLATYLDYPDQEVRKLVFDALHATQTPEAIMALRAGLHDPSINIRITAVEYLGSLEDHESIHDLLDLLEQSEEPMLKCAILEALAHMGPNPDIISRIRQIFSDRSDPDRFDINQVDPVYIPGIIQLAGRTGPPELICDLILSIRQKNIYARDVIQVMGILKQRGNAVFTDGSIVEMITDFAQNPQLDKTTRVMAVDLLLNENNGTMAPQELFHLGKALIQDPDMVFAGINAIAGSGHPKARETLATIAAETRDEEIRLICEELLQSNDLVFNPS